MRSITDFLKEVKQDYPDALAGKSSAGGFDGPPLPDDREYRATVVRGEWRQAQSGNYSFAFTFEITFPEEFAGRKFSEYYSIDKGNAIAAEKFSRFIGESGVDLADVDQSNNESFAAAFEGSSFIIATRIWGQDADRTGIRYLNRDRGQEPKASIQPPKKKAGAAKSLTADIQLPKRGEEPFPEERAAETEVAVNQPTVTLPGSGVRPPVSLPPGLARS